MTVQCDAWTQPRTQRWGTRIGSHRCPNPARYRVRSNDRPGELPTVPLGPETPCRRHVRPYAMDNGDSVWKPWIIEKIEEAK